MDLKILAKICSCFPKGTLSVPLLGASYIIDTHGEIMGHFDYSSSRIFITTTYSHAAAAATVLKKAGLNYQMVEYVIKE